ncbi:MAG: Ig-like domain-containing protein, partial [Methanobacteriaceae archaeon]
MNINMHKKLLLLLVAMAFFMTIIGAASAAEYDTALALTTNDADNTINTGDPITLEAHLQVEGSNGQLSDVQNAPVNFRVDGATIATVNTGVNGLASYIYTPTTPGQKLLTATYAGSSSPQRNPSTSNTVLLTVCAHNPNQGVNPVANDDAVTNAVEDTPFAAGVAGNDVFGSGTNTWAVTTPALHGNVVMNPLDGTYTYTPTGTNYFGQDTFIYTLSAFDGYLTRTDTALVTITIANVNDAPVAVDDTANTNEDTPVTINVLANDSDPDGNTLTVTGVTQPANGSVVINGGSTVTYTPNSNWNGVDTFTYTISDGNGGTDTAMVTVTVNSVADADLVLSKTVNNAVPVVKDTVIFTLIVNNNGPDTAV